MEKYVLVHPMCTMDYIPNRMPFVEASGIMIEDFEGREYYDLVSGLWNVPLGYRNEQVMAAIIDQTQKIGFCNLIEQPADITVQYAQKLGGYFSGFFQKLVFTCSGSESSDLAIKLSRGYQKAKGTKRKTIGVLNLSYHGTTYGAMSVSGIDCALTEDYQPLVGGVAWIPTPTPSDYANSDVWVCLFEAFVESYKDELAGIMVEPVIASGGIVEIPADALKVLASLCREQDIVLIFDEVATGFGRTGYMFACEKVGVYPDVICLSKAITNGYVPMGVVMFNGKVETAFLESGQIIEHFSTQNGNPIACAAAMATLECLVQNYDSFEVNSKGQYFCNKLKNNFKNTNITIEFRQVGLMIALDIKNAHTQTTLKSEELFLISRKLRESGVLVYMFYNENINSGISLLPPYIITYEEIDAACSKIIRVINRMRIAYSTDEAYMGNRT